MRHYWRTAEKKNEDFWLTKAFKAADAVLEAEKIRTTLTNPIAPLCECEMLDGSFEQFERVHAKTKQLESLIFLLAARHEKAAINICRQYGSHDDVDNPYNGSKAVEVFRSAHEFLTRVNDPNAQVIPHNKARFVYLVTKAVLETNKPHHRKNIDETIQKCAELSGTLDDVTACRLVSAGMRRLWTLQRFGHKDKTALIQQALLDSFSMHAKALCSYGYSKKCFYRRKVLGRLRLTIKTTQIPQQTRMLAATTFMDIIGDLPTDKAQTERKWLAGYEAPGFLQPALKPALPLMLIPKIPASLATRATNLIRNVFSFGGGSSR